MIDWLSVGLLVFALLSLAGMLCWAARRKNGSSVAYTVHLTFRAGEYECTFVIRVTDVAGPLEALDVAKNKIRENWPDAAFGDMRVRQTRLVN